MKVTDDMVNRFLSWRLPETFSPDGGVSFTPPYHPSSWPIGTNVLTAVEAKAMLEHVLESSDEPSGKNSNNAVHAAILRALDEAGIRDEVLRGMCIEVGLEKFSEFGEPSPGEMPRGTTLTESPASPSSPPETTGNGNEIAWLIERSWDGRAHWWIGNAFLPDAAQAVRFARRDDADRVILEQGLEGAVATEHMWCGGPVNAGEQHG